MDPVEMELVGVRIELPTNVPILLLREESGPRYLPIWIGPNEATAIALALQGVEPQRPMTHDLLSLVVTLSFASLAAKQIFRHFLRSSQPTFIAAKVYVAWFRN